MHPVAHYFYIFRLRTGGQQQISSKMRFIHVYDLRIAGLSGWRTATRKTQMILNSSSRSVPFNLLLHACPRSNLSRNDVDRADELHGKHTMFGRCGGDTVYSAFFPLSLSYAVNPCSNSDVMKIGAMGV